ncbi:MAG TPA: acetyl-CoA hydrolase/transferase C-terminal domain-containing protein [Candidatus Nanopelagicales bacterium]
MSRAQYEQLRCDPEQAVSVVRDGDTIVLPIGAGEAPALLHALSERRHGLRDVAVFQLLPLARAGYFDPETTEHVRHTTAFLSGTSRPGAAAGWIDVTPAHFSELPELFRRGLLPCDVVFARASAMDEHGYFSLGLATDYTLAAIQQARSVVLEVNPQVPYCFGHNHVHVSQLAALVESSDPIVELPHPAIGPVEQAIAAHVADLIPDGATLQIGIGAIPDAVVQQLSDKNDLGVHTEMFGDGILALLDAGVITNKRKNLRPGLMYATFALGSKHLYEYMDRNPALEMHPVDITNDPFLAGENDLLHSINGTLAVDLLGQCGSESLGTLPYSGTGGQVDFVRAANRSKGGKAIMVVPSTARGGTVSRIVPTLPEGTHVTTGKNDVNYVVTEYGVAQLRGRSARERARALIAVAHPDFRDELTEAASALHRR